MNLLLVPILAVAMAGTLSEADLARLAAERLPATLGADSLRWTVANPWASMPVPAGATDVRLTLPPGEPRPGVVSCAVQVTAHGRILTSVNAALRCERVGTGLRVRRGVRVGEVLTASDVTGVRGVLPPGERPLAEERLAEGMRVRRTLAADAWLTPSCVERAPVVKRDAPLEVRAEMASMVVRFQARAQQEGGLGDLIRARGPGRGALLTVRVTGPGTAELVP